MSRLVWVWLFVSCTVFELNAQDLPIPPNIQKAYEIGSRSKDGKPGPLYWQNNAVYDFSIEFNPDTRVVKGAGIIRYFNNSPDNLTEIYFNIHSNLYKRGVATKSRIKEEDRGEGVKFDNFLIEGKEISNLDIQFEGTNMILKNQFVPAGKSVDISLDFHYTLNKGSHVRTGQVDQGAFFIAYAIPRIAVYDDIDGWNTYSYNGGEEFYNDFSDFNISIEVPKDYVVWATGELLNPEEVFNAVVYEKYIQVELSDSIINVIDSVDILYQKVTQNQPSNTFKFKANNVPDFAFALSRHYLWQSKSIMVDSISGRKTRVNAVFNPSHKDYYEIIDFAGKTVHAMSFQFPKWSFPYPHITVFDGLDQMEYPMMANDNPTSSREEGIALTIHEIFHTMFPFYMGVNETKNAWMDEGWATLGEWLIAPMIDPGFVNTYGVKETAQNSGSDSNMPTITLTPQLSRVESFVNNYPKPAFAYLFLKDMLGESLFYKSLHYYIEQWNGKHPSPLDFFNSINKGSGKDLNWYWKKWFYEVGLMDLSLDGIHKTSSGYAIEVSNKGNYPLPIELNISLEDSSSTILKLNAGIWEDGNTIKFIPFKTTKKIKQVVLGGSHIPDKNSRNNVLQLK